MRSKFWFYAVPILSVILQVFLFIPGMGEEAFSIDDSILFNQKYLNTPWSWESFRTLMTPGNSPDFYPLRDLSVWIDWTFSKSLMVDTSVAKVQNGLWLLGIAILTYSILVRISKRPVFSSIMASAWLLHPFHLESLHWISARKDLMSWFFILAATLCLLPVESEERVNTKRMAFSLVMLVLSLLSKATFLALPFILLVWILWMRKKSNIKDIKYPNWFLIGGCCVSIFFVVINLWNYTTNSNMQMNEALDIRLLSVLAALGRNTVGILVPFYNAIDVEPWGGWFQYNRQFIPFGVVSLIALFACIIWGGRKNSYVLLGSMLVFGILLMTPGFNPTHRMFYSIRYFEPVFYVIWIGFCVFLVKRRHAELIGGILALICAVLVTLDSSNWQSNFLMMQKSSKIAPQDPSAKAMLLSEYLSLNIWGRLSADQKNEYGDLYNSMVSDCVLSVDANGRCLTFLAHLKFFAENLGVEESVRKDLYRHALDKMIAIKSKNFSDVAKSEVAWSVFNYRLEVDGRFDVESLREYFAGHKYVTDDIYRVRFLLFRCLDGDSRESQELYKSWINQNTIRKSEVNDFIACLKHEPLRKTAQNCLKTQN